ncbi:hypothetical protein L1049_010900 [Liquidambar formosana]|uniref:DUF4378 domain-containing protein n=1 Tax=Liquidambar formosana TaxID=63359 RepID=A0AAP0RW86_LIQFO
MERRQGTPSVIARLMGLDTLPPQQPIHKQQRVLSENYLRRTASIGVLEKRSSHEGRSFRMNVEEQQEFKDVFEVPDTPMLDNHQNLSVQKEKAKLSSNEAEIAFVRQKYMGVKSLSSDEKLQNPKEFHDAVEVLDSNRNLFLEDLQEPDSLFTKHLHDLQGVPLHSHLSRITVLKSLNGPNCRDKELCRKSERTTKQWNAIKLDPKLENDLVRHSHGGLGVDYSDKVLKLQLELNSETCLPTSKIVVLKPNLGKAQKAARSIFPHSLNEDSQSGNRKHKDIPTFENGELFIEVGERKHLVKDLEPLRHRSRVSRETAKEITRQMRHSMSNSSTDVSKSGFRGDDTSADESEVMTPASPNSFDWKNRYQTSFSHSNGSFLAQEAKKHLLERWKMTRRFQEVGLASSGSTLGEMLAMPDPEMGPRNLDYKLGGKHVLRNQFGLNNRDANSGSPVGINSMEGWKDGCVRNSRSKSLPSSTAIGSPKTRTRHESIHNDRYLMAMEAVSGEQNKSRMQTFGCSRPRKSTSSCKNSESFPCLSSETCAIMDDMKNRLNEKDLNEQNYTFPKSSFSSVPCSDSETNNTVQETRVIQDDLKNNFEKDLSERNSRVLNSSCSGVASTSMVADAKIEVSMFSGIYMEQESKATTCNLLLKDANSTSHVLQTSIQQETSIGSPEEVMVPLRCPRLDPESPVRSEEASQPSPVSVLESPSKEETLSGTECFESVSADLHGSQMQLQLLKVESPEEYTEEPEMIVSSDEDTGQGSVGLAEEIGEKMGFFRAKESRDFSYLVDVLVEAGFYGGNLEKCFKTWHSPECPISPTVFERLEKKYCQQTSWESSDRRLLFDFINSGFMGILQRCVDTHMLVKSMAKRFSPWWSWEVIEEELWMLVVSQEKEASKDSSEKVLGRDTRWLELGDDIYIIGGEIERLLMDDLVAEVVSSENF